MLLFIKAYNFAIGMLIGLLIVYWVKRRGGGFNYVKEETAKMD